MLLPVAFRSLSRLSSALSAKASTLRSCSLNQRVVSIALLTIGSRVYICLRKNLFLLSVVTINMVHSSFEERTYLMSFSWFIRYVSVFGFQGSKMTNFLSVIKSRKCFQPLITGKTGIYVLFLFLRRIRQPPALPYRLQHSTIGRLSLNHRVRDENGCVP